MVDARGFSCPMPVLMTKKAIQNEKPNSIDVLVDNSAAVMNVARYAQSVGYHVETEKAEDDYLLHLTND